jgi:hypothetical protein
VVAALEGAGSRRSSCKLEPRLRSDMAANGARRAAKARRSGARTVRWYSVSVGLDPLRCARLPTPRQSTSNRLAIKPKRSCFSTSMIGKEHYSNADDQDPVKEWDRLRSEYALKGS